MSLKVRLLVIDEDSEPSSLPPMTGSYDAGSGEGVFSVSSQEPEYLGEIRQALRSAWECCDDVLIDQAVQAGRLEVFDAFIQARSKEEDAEESSDPTLWTE